jgi:hypothetical protein
MVHVFFEGAFVAEGVVSYGGFLGEEAVEASWRAVAWDRGVWAAAMAGVVVSLQVATLAAYPAAFVGGWVAWASVCVMSEEETPPTLAMLYVGCGELY